MQPKQNNALCKISISSNTNKEFKCYNFVKGVFRITFCLDVQVGEVDLLGQHKLRLKIQQLMYIVLKDGSKPECYKLSATTTV